jgi:hypothetical protein
LSPKEIFGDKGMPDYFLLAAAARPDDARQGEAAPQTPVRRETLSAR